MPQRPSVDYKVYVDGVHAPFHKVVSMVESAGSERLDVATIEINGDGFDDFSPTGYQNKEIGIERVQTGEIVHWGKSTLVPTVLTPKGETIHVVSRTELYHLGGRVNGYYVWDPLQAEPVLVDGELVFNPLIDGLIYGNLNDSKTTNGDSPGNLLLLDPESVRTAAARTLQDADVDTWVLAGAVHYLLWSLNSAETYVTNLSLVALAAIFTDPDAEIRDVLIPRGTYLGQALDLLLEPLGYRWKVKRTALGAREFAFWKRGSGGSLVTVTHQRNGEELDVALTNVETAGLTFDISTLANEVTVKGGFGEYEVTAELARAWAAADDPTAGAGDELSQDHPAFDTLRNVLRKWVLNEAGDYIGLRTEIDGVFTSAFRALLASEGFLDPNLLVPRRRRLLPTLTLDTDGTPIGKVDGVEVEYSNVAGDPDWKLIDGLQTGCSLLQREGGVYFNCNRLPEEFLTSPANLRIRATFTLQVDLRLRGYAAKAVDSPNEDIVPLVVSVPDRFRLRVRDDLTLSKYAGSGAPSLEVDDLAAANDFAEYVRAAWDLMKVGGTIQIEGLDSEYAVGDRVEKIAEKDMSFEAKAASGMYPQIVAIERNVSTQTMVLHLEQFRDPLQLPSPTRGTRQRFAPWNTGRRVLR